MIVSVKELQNSEKNQVAISGLEDAVQELPKGNCVIYRRCCAVLPKEQVSCSRSRVSVQVQCSHRRSKSSAGSEAMLDTMSPDFHRFIVLIYARLHNFSIRRCLVRVLKQGEDSSQNHECRASRSQRKPLPLLQVPAFCSVDVMSTPYLKRRDLQWATKTGLPKCANQQRPAGGPFLDPAKLSLPTSSWERATG